MWPRMCSCARAAAALPQQGRFLCRMIVLVLFSYFRLTVIKQRWNHRTRDPKILDFKRIEGKQVPLKAVDGGFERIQCLAD